MGVKCLPLDSGRRLVRVFESFGWTLRRSQRNHLILTNPTVANVVISIPDHREVDRKLLKAEIRKAGLTDEEFRSRYDEL